MQRLFVGNFDFEHQLVGRTPSARLRRLNAELATTWLAVADDGDFLFTPEPLDPDFFDEVAERGLPRVQPVTNFAEIKGGVELIPWGWSAETATLAQRIQPQRTFPDPAVVKQVNSRQFSCEEAQRLGCALTGEVLIRQPDEFATALKMIRGNSAAWVMKANFGMSARERILGDGLLTETQRNWLNRRLQLDGAVVFEPWLDRVDEVGVQWELPRSGSPILLGVVPMQCDRNGQYAGSQIMPLVDIGEWQSVLEIQEQTVLAMQRLGYFGPVGIDAMRFRDAAGNLRFRPLQDINARWTMGRLALGVGKRFSRSETGVWRHSTAAEFHTRVAGPSAPRIITTSPEFVGDSLSQHRHWLDLVP